MPYTSFDPITEGFHFSNAKIQWTFGPFSSTQLCGGMAYAALDYYYSEFVTPSDTTAPVEKTTLHSYIYSRQVDAHVNTVPRFAGSWAPIIGPLFAEVQQGPEIRKLAEYMAGDTPIPICLVGRGNGHHVVAIGYQATPFAIDIYDPNIPDKTVQLVQKGGSFVNTGSNANYRGFFVDDGYGIKLPPNLGGENGWRHCYRCRSLFYGGPGDSPCPGGGQHYAFGSSDYVLNLGGGRGEGGWRYCNKCQGLHYAFDSTFPGVCPAGGFHLPDDHWKYRLAVDVGGEVAGQSNWHRCSNCQSVYFRGASAIGICPTGEGHSPDLSVRYKIPFK